MRKYKMTTLPVHFKRKWQLLLTVVFSLSIYSSYSVIWNNAVISVDEAKRINFSFDIGEVQSHFDELIDKRYSNWTILLTVNEGFFDFFQNWFIFYRDLHIYNKIIVIAEDEAVYKQLITLDLDYVLVERSWLNSMKTAVIYGSKEFTVLVSARPTYILNYLNKGLNILYADIDAVWLQNPFRYFYGDYDMWMQLDSENNYCTGFIALKSNEASIQLMRNWELFLQQKLWYNQRAFNAVVKGTEARLKALDNDAFPSGRQFFDQFIQAERSQVVVVHNNYIKGHDVKKKRFQDYSLWKVSDLQDDQIDAEE